MKYKPTVHTAKIKKWLGASPKARASKTLAWLEKRGHGRYGIAHFLHGDKLANERKEFAAEFHIR